MSKSRLIPVEDCDDINDAPAATSNSPTRGRVKIPHLAMAGRAMITRFDAPWQDARRIL